MAKLQSLLRSLRLDQETRNNLILAESLFDSSCHFLERLVNSDSLANAFRSPNLKQLARMVQFSPEVLHSLVDAIVKEDLHRFIVHNQLPDLIEDFPAAFCNASRPNNFLSFVGNGSATTRGVILRLCAEDWSKILNELVEEFIPVETFVRMASPNATFDLVKMLNSSDCALKAAMEVDWNTIFRFEAILEAFEPILLFGESR